MKSFRSSRLRSRVSMRDLWRRSDMGPLAGAGAAAFWKLIAEHVPNAAERNLVGWAAVLQAIAILTPKGRDPQKKSAHDRQLPMGSALYKAGLSELRLASLLAATSDRRRERAIRACRRIAASELNRFDLVTLAQFILFGDDRNGPPNRQSFLPR